MKTIKMTVVGIAMLVGSGLASASEAGAGQAYGPDRHPAAPDVVLQENAADLGVDGWTVHAAISIAAAARPELDRLRDSARAARDAWARGKGSEQAFVAARRALRGRALEMLAEIEGLLTAAQAKALRALVIEELRAERA